MRDEVQVTQQPAATLPDEHELRLTAHAALQVQLEQLAKKLNMKKTHKRRFIRVAGQMWDLPPDAGAK